MPSCRSCARPSSSSTRWTSACKSNYKLALLSLLFFCTCSADLALPRSTDSPACFPTCHGDPRQPPRAPLPRHRPLTHHLPTHVDVRPGARRARLDGQGAFPFLSLGSCSFAIADCASRSQVVIVTGANVGIGYETAKQLVLKNAKVYIACRDETKAREAIHKLEAFVTERHTKGQLEFLKLDLSDLDAVKQAADDFLAKEKQLDLLFCNAGVMKCPPDLLTKQNYDLQWGASRLVARSACSAESVSRQERTSSVTTYFACALYSPLASL